MLLAAKHADRDRRAIHRAKQLLLQCARGRPIGDDTLVEQDQAREVARRQVEVVQRGENRQPALGVEAPQQLQRLDLPANVQATPL